MPEITRADEKILRKKRLRLHAMEDHLESLKVHIASETSIQAVLDELTAAIQGVALANRPALNNAAAIVRIRSILNSEKAREQSRQAGQRNNINDINVLIQADSDYSVAEKAEAQALKDNEV